MKLDAENEFVRFLTPARMPETVGSGTSWYEGEVYGETHTANIG